MSDHLSLLRIVRIVAVLGAAVLAGASCAQTQDSVSDCGRAIQIVRGGEPASLEERAWSTLPGCGDAGGVAARNAWTSLRSVSDSARVAQVYERVRSFRDSSLFGAARTVLLDSVATAEVRVSSAMLVVAQLVDGADPDYHVFSTTGAHDVCAIGSATDRSLRDGAPLPSDARALAESAALRVLASASAPQRVRNAARCMYDAVARDDRVLAQQTPAPSVEKHLTESAGRLDVARPRLASDAHPRARPRPRRSLRQPVDSIRGIIRLGGGGGCPMQQPYLESSGGKRVRLAGSRDVFQLRGEVVMFGRETDPPRHPLSLPYPLFTIDSFFVRAYQGKRVYDGILRRSPRGDVLETRDGQRLPVANLPRTLDNAGGKRVWIGEPLGAPTIVGVIDPGVGYECAE